MGRKKGSKNKPKEPSPEAKEAAAISARSIAYIMTPELSDVIDNAIASNPKPPKIKDQPFPSDWDKMGKIARLEWLTAHPRK